jgi:hypothetical protein
LDLGVIGTTLRRVNGLTARFKKSKSDEDKALLLEDLEKLRREIEEILNGSK